MPLRWRGSCATTRNWPSTFSPTSPAWTGLDKEITEKVKVTRPVTKTVDGVEQTVEETVEETRKHIEPGYLEAVYHLFSMAKKHGPVVLRMRTVNRTDQVELPSLHAHLALGRVSGARGLRSLSASSSPAIPTCAAF